MKIFSLYRRGQGVGARAVAAVAVLVVGVFAGIEVYRSPSADSAWQKTLVRIPGIALEVTPVLIVAASLFLTLAAGSYMMVNYPKAADFLVDTESELQKVSWSSKEEVIGHAIVVIATVAGLAVFLYVADMWILKPVLTVIGVLPKVHASHVVR